MEAIVIVDLQRAFPLPSDLIARIEVRSTYFPLRVFTRFLNPPGSLHRRKLERFACSPGDPDRELLLKSGPGDLLFEKSGYGLSAKPVETLINAGVDRALVCGADTDGAVLGVAFSLFDAGIDCHIEPDLCWSSSGLHELALKIFQQQFGAS